LIWIESELDAVRYLYDFSAYIDDIPFEAGGLDSVPILLFIVEEFGFEDLIFEGDGGHILIGLFEEVSAGGREIDEIEIEERADKQKHRQSGNLKKFDDTIVALISADDSGVGLGHLAGDKSECSHLCHKIKLYPFYDSQFSASRSPIGSDFFVIGFDGFLGHQRVISAISQVIERLFHKPIFDAMIGNHETSSR